MTSTISGTTSFTLDVDDIIEQAYDPIGSEYTSMNDAYKARRLLNLVLIQMQNKNIPLSKLEEITLTLTANTASYLLDASVSDILKGSIRQTIVGTPVDQLLDLAIERRGLKEYHDIPMKDMKSRPNLFTTERTNLGVKATFWPVPQDDTYSAKLLVVKRVDDITASYQKVDLPYRYLPLLIKWLTYEIAMSKTGITEDKMNRIQAALNDVMPDTFEEDRERTDFTMKPGGISGR